MRHALRSYDEVCHIWANQRNISDPDERYARAGNVYFNNWNPERIWSYGSHYCLARIVNDDTVLLNDTHHSNTTAQHQSSVRSATSHFAHRIFCPDPNDTRSSMDRWEGRMNDLLRNLSVARKPENYLNELKTMFKNIQEYADATGENLKVYEWWMKVKRTRNLDKYLLKLAAPYAEEVKRERQEKRVRDAELREQNLWYRANWSSEARKKLNLEERWADYLNEWETGERRNFPNFPECIKSEHLELKYEFLRETGVKGRIQTSKNVVIPRDIARKFGERLKNGLLEIGERLMNYYTVTQCDSEITRIGCHTFRTPYLIQWYDKLAAEV